MKISCPTCAAKYSVADEKIQSRLAKIRCRKCSSTIVIDGTASPANVYIGEGPALVSGNPPADGAAAELGSAEPAPGSGRFGGVGFTDPAPATSEPMGPAADEYAVDIADNDQRNMTIHQIVGAYNEGLITADTYIWKEGMADWQTLAEVREVATALHAAARAVGSSPVASPLAAASVGMPAAVRRADHGGARDLFGGIDRAGGEDDIHTSAPEATPSFTAGTGARNESSVLFSLSALTGTEASSTPSGKRRASSDDSGLIDLQALTAAEAAAGGAYAASPVGAFGASPLISAPLGGVSGPAGGGLGGSYGRSPGGKLGLIVGALALGLCIVAATAFVLKGGADQEPALALEPGRGTEQVAPAAEGIAEPSEPSKPTAADPEPSAAEEPVAAAEKEEAKEPESAAREEAAPKAVARPRPRPAPKPKAPAAAPDPEPAPKPAASRPEPAASSSDEPKAKPKKKEKPCECKPSDLLCAMRCSAKK